MAWLARRFQAPPAYLAKAVAVEMPIERPVSEDLPPPQLTAGSEPDLAGTPNPTSRVRTPRVFMARRRGVASLLFALFRPGQARSATVTADSVKLSFWLRSREIPLRDVKAVRLKAGRRWGGARLEHAAGATTVSGLARMQAVMLADAVETATAARGGTKSWHHGPVRFAT